MDVQNGGCFPVKGFVFCLMKEFVDPILVWEFDFHYLMQWTGVISARFCLIGIGFLAAVKAFGRCLVVWIKSTYSCPELELADTHNLPRLRGTSDRLLGYSWTGILHLRGLQNIWGDLSGEHLCISCNVALQSASFRLFRSLNLIICF